MANWDAIRQAAWNSMAPHRPAFAYEDDGALSAEQLDNVLNGLHPTGVPLGPRELGYCCGNCGLPTRWPFQLKCRVAAIKLQRIERGDWPDPVAGAVPVRDGWPACEDWR